MDIVSFIDFLGCLYNTEVSTELAQGNQSNFNINQRLLLGLRFYQATGNEDLTNMVFSGDFGGNDQDVDQVTQSRQAMRTARCVKLLGKGVVKVVHRCDDALENNNLDLSECQLMQIPDAVFHLMRNTELQACNLSHNVISKIPPKLALNFTTLIELNLSHNRISSLPNEMTSCSQLETLDISANSFVQLPPVLAEIPSLRKLVARKNFVAEVEVEAVVACAGLEHLNLEENPLKREIYDQLANVTTIRVILSPKEMEDWEDLSIWAPPSTSSSSSIYS